MVSAALDAAGGVVDPRRAWRLPASTLALLAAACWAFAAVAAKDVFADVPPARVAQVRALVTAVLLLGYLVLRRRVVSVSRDALVPLIAFGALLALVNGSYYLAIRRLPVGVALSIQYTGPLLVLAVRRRRVPPRLWLAAVAALAGAALVAGIAGGRRPAAAGLVFAVLSAVGFAGYLLTGEVVSRRLGSVAGVAYGFAAASVVWAIAQPWWTFPFATLTRPGVPGRLATVSLAGTLLPFLLMLAALRRIAAGPAGVLATAEPGFGAVFAWLLLSERLTGVQVAGLALVTAGVAVVQARETPEPELEVVG